MDYKPIAAKLRPSKEEATKVSVLTKAIMAGIKVPGARVVLGGSFGKGTRISGAHDVDIFVCFDYAKFKSKSNDLASILAKYLKGRRVHGSRDYFEIRKHGLVFEVIPILDIKRASQAVNITDVSPLHTKWVVKSLKGKEDEVRLLKAFLASNNCYGAESHIRGLSGYACEILVAYYGSFEKLIRACLKWKDKAVIDIRGFYKGKNCIGLMNSSKVQGPIIIVDPVQPDRNAAAGFSYDALSRLRSVISKFQKEKDPSFFFDRKVSASSLLENADVVVKAVPLPGKEDVSLSKVLKVFDFFRSNLVENGFAISGFGVEWLDFPVLWLKVKPIPSTFIIQGPPVSMLSHLERFRKAHPSAKVKAGKVSAVVRRKFTDPGVFLRSLASSDFLKGRVRKVVVLD